MVTICTHVPKLCDGLMKYGKWVMISLSVTNPFLIHGEVLKQMQGLKDPDEPVYHMTEDQYCIQMGVRCPGEPYPAAAKDKAVWECYECKQDFEEWKDTRVLYKNLAI